MRTVVETLASKAPLTARNSRGVWTGRADGRLCQQRWMYRRLPAETLLWKDPPARQAHTARLQNMFARFAAGGGRREMHLLALRWDTKPEMPAATAAGQRELLDPVFASFSQSVGLCAVGVKLKTLDRSGEDTETMEQIFDLVGAQPLTAKETLRVEAWWAGGAGRHANVGLGSRSAGPGRAGSIVYSDTYPEGFTFSTLVDAASLADVNDDSAMWASGVLHSHEAAHAVSVRGVVAVDVGADDWLRLQRCSVVIAHCGSLPSDWLRQLCGIETYTIRARSTGDALAETAPLGVPRVGVPPSPYVGDYDADVAVRVVSRSGIVSGGGVGDLR